MNMFKLFTILAVTTTLHVSCNKQPDKPQKALNFGQSALVGGLVGATEVTFPGQPLSYAMNEAIKNSSRSFIERTTLNWHKQETWKQAYKGYGANAGGQMPITAMQLGIKSTGTQWLQASQDDNKLSDLQNAGVSYVAGLGGALVDTPSNAVQLYMQNKANAGKRMTQAIKELGRKSWRGLAPNACLKEGPFAVGYQMLAPKGNELAQRVVGDNYAAPVLGGIAAGVVTAVATQPGAVIRNKMQGDLTGEHYATTAQTVAKICKEEGVKALWNGLQQRGARVAVAIPLYVAYTKVFSEALFPESKRT